MPEYFMTVAQSELQQDLPKLITLVDEFVEDVLPQAGKLCFQNYGNLNEMCLLLKKFKDAHVD